MCGRNAPPAPRPPQLLHTQLPQPWGQRACSHQRLHPLFLAQHKLPPGGHGPKNAAPVTAAAAITAIPTAAIPTAAIPIAVALGATVAPADSVPAEAIDETGIYV
ncbi:hypothetical protein Vafri_10973 [Volvox africanus]|uniref:Uncharacterized protein n=1 Tax=Volvox africanus TaxID=51714 RepID=A0A8J4B883_9CHLO|nr:hypothetical protein Vafri_10973 [Volvox africanus]